MLASLFAFAGAAFEATAATNAAVVCWSEGGSIEDSLRAFADCTKTEIDDRAVDAAVDAIEMISEETKRIAAKSLALSVRVHRASADLEDKVPEIRDAIEKFSRIAATVAYTLDGFSVREVKKD